MTGKLFKPAKAVIFVSRSEGKMTALQRGKHYEVTEELVPGKTSKHNEIRVRVKDGEGGYDELRVPVPCGRVIGHEESLNLRAQGLVAR